MLAVCTPFDGGAPAPGNGNMVAIAPGSKELAELDGRGVAGRGCRGGLRDGLVADGADAGQTIADYGYPEPDEPHPITTAAQQRKIDQAMAAAGGASPRRGSSRSRSPTRAKALW